MTVPEAVACVLRDYPRIFFACHRRHVRDEAARRTLSSHQASILDHLDDVDAITLAGLAAHMGVTPSTMSLNIDRLVDQGYVLRQRDTEDARRVNLRLSAAGLRIKQSQSVLDPERLAQVLAQLSAEELGAAARGLRLLAQAAAAAPAERRWFGHEAEPPRHAGGTKRKARAIITGAKPSARERKKR